MMGQADKRSLISMQMQRNPTPCYFAKIYESKLDLTVQHEILFLKNESTYEMKSDFPDLSRYM